MSVKSPDPVDAFVGESIRKQRLALGLSQTALALALGITFQQVQKYEKGVNRVGAGRLTKIADTLRVPVSRFFDGAQQPNATEPRTAASDPLHILGLTREGVALARAFNDVTNPNLRKALVEMAEAAAQATSPQHQKAA